MISCDAAMVLQHNYMVSVAHLGQVGRNLTWVKGLGKIKWVKGQRQHPENP